MLPAVGLSTSANRCPVSEFARWTTVLVRIRYAIDPYFVAGLVAVLIAGMIAIMREAHRRLPSVPRDTETVIAKLDSLELGHRYGVIDAPVRVAELSDFGCPACAVAHEVTWPIIVKYAAEGALTYTAYDFVLPPHRSMAIPAAAIVDCVELLQPSRVWAMRSGLFANQSEWVKAYPIENALLANAANLPVDTTEMRSCMRATSLAKSASLEAAWNIGSVRGLTAVPVWIVNGRVVAWRQLEQSILKARRGGASQ